MKRKHLLLRRRGQFGFRAQAMVEFAIALPVLLVLVVGVMEVGRMVLTYAMVTNASRDAVRYASAVGIGDDGYDKYNNCVGIQNLAKNSAYIVALSSVTIKYYDANGNYKWDCDRTTVGEDTDISVASNYSVKVTVEASYKPVVKLIPIGQKDFSATSTRTILGIFDLNQ